MINEHGRYVSKKEALKNLELSIREPRDRRRIAEIKEYLDIYLTIVNTPLWKRFFQRLFKTRTSDGRAVRDPVD